jgi:transmembrane sensor
MSEQKHTPSSKDFLQNDQFIEWRLFKSEESERYWENYLLEHPECADALQLAIRKFEMVKVNNNDFADHEKTDLYDRLIHNIYRNKYRHRLAYVSAGIAAAFMAAFILLLSFGDHLKIPGKKEIVVAPPKSHENITFYANGEGFEFKQGDTRFELLPDGKMIVSDSMRRQTLNIGPKTMGKLVVPAGKRSFLTLSDGSRIWINSCSEIGFPSVFSAEKREMTVHGEIFAEINRDETKQFLVHTSLFHIIVHGTSFNTNADLEFNKGSVVLVNGSLSVKTLEDQTIQLNPGQLLTINGTDYEKRTDINVEEYTCWKDGKFIFNLAPFSSMLNKISRYYDVSFRFDQDLTQMEKKYSGKLYLSENIDSVMVSLTTITSTSFSRKGKTIFISGKDN